MIFTTRFILICCEYYDTYVAEIDYIEYIYV